MSVGLPAIAIIEFDAMVKAAYQGSGKLRSRVRVKTGVVGSSAKFRRFNKGMATPRITQTDVVPMNITYGEATAAMQDWVAAEYSDLFDQAATNIDERPVVATNIAGAIGRREDQMIIDVLEANAGSPDVDTAVGGAASGLNMAKIRRAKKILDDRAVPNTDRTFVHSAAGLETLLGITEVTSSDYNSIKALVQGEINTWVGFLWVMIETRAEGGLAYAATLRSNFAFHKDAVGLAIGIDFRTEVNYIAEKTSWLANGLFKAGATVIDPLGVVEVQTTEP
jgi:hypothetical protein